MVQPGVAGSAPEGVFTDSSLPAAQLGRVPLILHYSTVLGLHRLQSNHPSARSPERVGKGEFAGKVAIITGAEVSIDGGVSA